MPPRNEIIRPRLQAGELAVTNSSLRLRSAGCGDDDKSHSAASHGAGRAKTTRRGSCPPVSGARPRIVACVVRLPGSRFRQITLMPNALSCGRIPPDAAVADDACRLPAQRGSRQGEPVRPDASGLELQQLRHAVGHHEPGAGYKLRDGHTVRAAGGCNRNRSLLNRMIKERFAPPTSTAPSEGYSTPQGFVAPARSREFPH